LFHVIADLKGLYIPILVSDDLIPATALPQHAHEIVLFDFQLYILQHWQGFAIGEEAF